ncbi:cobalt/nickel transport system ATP-binding protein [Methanomicrobium sp. W14]|uniref:energy-coupling factor ABC transporter ATP-binding protein n=1 Tax=Methanomicrobium sp. W14 TaxID=2817839 RepID=UPI001AE6A437|nr:ATP-binding cassette domain-containing protein [Methanomicrobium sp. W14]MBP2132758.1 cobalt/nickel transport system ATP-binding protein [Methanomicrobium sp. W14]
MNSPIIELKGVSYKYSRGPKALDNVSFSVNKGEKVALVGPNGAGKSTLLLMLNGMLKPGSGEILFNGEPVCYDRKNLRELRQRVGFVFQNPDTQIIAPTVFQDVAFGPVNLGMPGDEVKKAVSDSLLSVGLKDFERRPPQQLSGGEKKRVAMAGILAMNPDVLVFDEPTSALDPAGSEDIMELLDEMHIEGRTIIISTHDVELAYPWADRIILMQSGAVISMGAPGEVFKDKKLIKSAKLSMPILLELYEGLVERGMPQSENLPKSVLDFIHALTVNGYAGEKTAKEDCGVIYLLNSDKIDTGDIKPMISGYGISAVGAMGSGAKMMAGIENIDLDFTYGVIDKCLLKSINHKNSMIITSGGMVKRVHERIAEFNRESLMGISLVDCEVPRE